MVASSNPASSFFGFARELVDGEDPKDTIAKVKANLRGRSVLLQCYTPDQVSTVVANAFLDRLREAGAVVNSSWEPSVADYKVEFSMINGPEFRFTSTTDNRTDSFRPVKWPLNGRSLQAAMTDDITLQGLYHLAMFVGPNRS